MSRRAREWSRTPQLNIVDTEDITMKTKTNVRAGIETHKEDELY